MVDMGLRLGEKGDREEQKSYVEEIEMIEMRVRLTEKGDREEQKGLYGRDRDD